MPTTYIAAVDGGASKTRAVVAGLKGEVLGEGRSSGSNPNIVGVEQAAHVVIDALNQALAKARIKQSARLITVAGLAGVRNREIHREMLSKLTAVLPYGLELLTDVDIAMAAVPAHISACVIVVAGTGSAAMARDRLGLRPMIGGFGPVVGDSGSATAIGQAGVKCVLELADQGITSLLHTLLLDALQVSDLGMLKALLYDPSKSPWRIYASLAPTIARAATRGCPYALGIMSQAGRALAMLAATAANKLTTDQPVEVYKVGGLWGAGDEICLSFRDRLYDASHTVVNICRQPLDPIVGAIHKARKQMDLSLAA